MLDLDLRASKLEKEKQQRLEKLKRERESEAKRKLEYEKKQQELHELARLNREREEALRIQREEEEARWMELSGGIQFYHEFRQFHVLGKPMNDTEEPEEQDNDKITLSEDCLNELMQQDCFSRFPVMLFRLEATVRYESLGAPASANGCGPDGKSDKKSVLVTHAGVKEFSSPKHSIGLPRKVLASLGGNIESIDSISVRFILLEKGTYAKLRPRYNQFFEVGPVKRCLEENLRYHATLTVGDILTVWYRGKPHEMKVIELRPGNEVTVIDTDLEIDLDLSEEFTAQQQQNANTGKKLGSAGLSLTSSSNLPLSSTPPPLPPANVFTNSTAHSLRAPVVGTASISTPMEVETEYPEFYSHQSALEPEAGSIAEGKTTLLAKIKLPNGKTFIRKFFHQQPVLQLFLAVSKELGLDNATQHWFEQQRLIVSTRFPPRSLALASMSKQQLHQSFEDLEIKVASEQFFVSFA